MFKVGGKIVCVDGDKWPNHGAGHETYPVKGVVYTIREIDIWEDLSDPFGGVRLVEIVNKPDWYRSWPSAKECTFSTKRFRLIKTTSIDVFLKMLESERSSATTPEKIG